MKCDKCGKDINRGMAGSEHVIREASSIEMITDKKREREIKEKINNLQRRQ